MGALGFQFVSAEAAHAWVHAYYNAYLNQLDKLTDYETNPNIALVSGFMCCETDEEALRKADGWTFFQFALRYYASRGAPVEPGAIQLWEEYQSWKETPKAQAQRVSGLVGSPDTIRKRLRKFEASNIDQVILLNQAGKNTHEDICASLELFAREVMPEFHAREPEHRRWKRAVLARELELPAIDTSAHGFERGKLDESPQASRRSVHQA
jgi:alkanesulfonate monooxygenase SsuD/methylene tetrahydromethanopterin reductase-like flavin-dependent oxidoreductase (luciferase family)